MIRIFVYGTLRTGQSNFVRMLSGRVNKIVAATAKGMLYDLPFGYPAMLEGDGEVVGELMEFNDADLLHDLDRLEGYMPGNLNNIYERKWISVHTSQGENFECWVWIYANASSATAIGEKIEDGDWVKLKNSRLS